MKNMIWKKSWFPVWYGFCPTEEIFRKEMLKSTDPHCDYPVSAACTVKYHDDRGDCCALVTLREDMYSENEKYPFLIPGLIVHEAVHVVEATIERMADPHPSEEFRAYATQAIFVELMIDVENYIRRRKEVKNGHND